MAEKEMNIEDLIPDDHNFNRGTEQGQKLIDKSFTELGAGRSVLIDKDNRIIAGNKSQQGAIAAGIKKVRVIETDGSELIAVKRTDVDIDSSIGRQLALADNATTKINLVFDHAELSAQQIEVDLNPDIWGVPNLLDDEDKQTEYQVVVDVNDEKEQEKLYNRMTAEGFDCKIITI